MRRHAVMKEAEPPAIPREFWLYQPHKTFQTMDPRSGYRGNDESFLAQFIHVVEMAALTRANEEIERLKSILPTFIKLDETTEAFVQTHAAIENMKMFQRDVAFLKAQLAEALAEVERQHREIERFKASRDRRIIEGGEMATKIFALEAELATLRFELEAKQRPLGEQVLELTIERDRYKAALEKIASGSYATCETQIAREALGNKS